MIDIDMTNNLEKHEKLFKPSQNTCTIKPSECDDSSPKLLNLSVSHRQEGKNF